MNHIHRRWVMALSIAAAMLAGAAAIVLHDYPDDIRVLALDVIANLPDPALRDSVWAVYTDEEEAVEVRQHAGAALQQILLAKADMTLAQRDQLRKMTSDPDSILSAQAVHALAIAAIPQEEREEFIFSIEQAE